MAKDPKILEFLEARGDTVDNLQAIRLNLENCVEEGMHDTEASYYNELLVLIDETTLSETWDELMEVISKAKVLEADVDTWLADHGRSSLSLPWTKGPASQGQ